MGPHLSLISMLSSAHFNGVQANNCNSGFKFDQSNDGFFFNVPLGECNMDTLRNEITKP